MSCERRTRRSGRSPATLAVMVLAAASLWACSSDPKQGYSFASTYSQKIRTISVPIFENASYRPGMERELTEAIIKEIQRTTKWTVVAGGSADATLSGTLRSANYDALSTLPQTGQVQEMAVNLRIDFDLTDNRTGKDVVRRRSFQAVDTFVATRSVGERQEIGQHAVVDAMARDLVAELREKW